MEQSDSPKIVATMTTIPSRIASIRPVVESILSQSVPVDHLEINIPFFCKRTNEVYVIPSWLKECNKVKIYRCDDYGSITKVAPTFQRYIGDNETYLWSIDDDVSYPSGHLALLMIPFDPTRRQVLTRYGGDLTSDGTIKPWTGTADVGYFEGFGSILYPPNCVGEKFLLYLEKTSQHDICKRADDIVLSMYFKHIGIPIRLHNRPTTGTPYMLTGSMPHSKTDPLSEKGHADNYRKVFVIVSEILKTM